LEEAEKIKQEASDKFDSAARNLQNTDAEPKAEGLLPDKAIEVVNADYEAELKKF
jgi:hypothetical protein